MVKGPFTSCYHECDVFIIQISCLEFNVSVHMVRLRQRHYIGIVYTKRQRQRCDNSAMILAILFSLKTVQNGVATNFQVTPLFSMRTELLASLQSCRSIDADAWCKWTLNSV